MTALLSEERQAEARRILIQREYHRRLCAEHPAYLRNFVECVDAKTGDRFDFDLLTAEEREEIGGPGEPGGWFWQRELLDEWLAYDRWVGLKARQIGVTWLAAGLALQRDALQAGDPGADRLHQRGRGEEGDRPDLGDVPVAARLPARARRRDQARARRRPLAGDRGTPPRPAASPRSSRCPRPRRQATARRRTS